MDRQQVLKMASDLLEKKLASYHMTLTILEDFQGSRIKLLGNLIYKIWDNLLAEMGAFDDDRTALQSEQAIAGFIHRGLPKKDVEVSYPVSAVQLKYLTYLIVKEGVGFSAKPSVNYSSWGYKARHWVKLPAEEFVEFVMEFDNLIPDIARFLDGRLREFQIRAVQHDILRQTVNSLGEQYLAPKGITWTLGDNFTTDSILVNFYLPGHRNLHEIIPTDALAETIMAIPAKILSLQ